MALIGSIELVNPSESDIISYIERMEQLFQCNEVPKEGHVAMTLIGGEAYNVLKDSVYPVLPSTKTYKDLKEALSNHYCPKKLKIHLENGKSLKVKLQIDGRRVDFEIDSGAVKLVACRNKIYCLPLVILDGSRKFMPPLGRNWLNVFKLNWTNLFYLGHVTHRDVKVVENKSEQQCMSGSEVKLALANSAEQFSNSNMELIKHTSEKLNRVLDSDHFIDLNGAYQQLQISETSRELLTINTHVGLFTYNNLTYSISAAPGIFQTVMDTMLSGLSNTKCDFDDILIFGESLKHCHKYVTTVLKRLKEFNLKGIPVSAAARITRWAITLSGYTNEIEYKKGKLVSNADGLSRLSMDEATDVPDYLYPFNLINNVPLHNEDIFKERHELTVEQNCLLLGNKVDVRKALRNRILELFHEHHLSIVRRKMLRSYCWWPGLNDDVEKFISSCEVCQQTQNFISTNLLRSWPPTPNNFIRKFSINSTGLSPAEDILKNRPRTRFDLLKPDIYQTCKPTGLSTNSSKLYNVNELVYVKNAQARLWNKEKIVKVCSHFTYLILIKNEVKFVHADSIRPRYNDVTYGRYSNSVSVTPVTVPTIKLTSSSNLNSKEDKGDKVVQDNINSPTNNVTTVVTIPTSVAAPQNNNQCLTQTSVVPRSGSPSKPPARLDLYYSLNK
ncbi:hypothetical protein ILUMI_16918 [Ignelater luminosus]|uniref:RNA-directed DNA polymerase n=1 Tax=Ignelater luminosus TaxID=2038154 RepID=A0A8K0CTE6_IGNLU|nr:hypothetical protein ILUMI_16918 [Ignelater luminosus]